MRKTRDRRRATGALTSFQSPSTSSSSSDFEFTVSASPSSGRSACPADELFYKGQLLPLHLSPRISMVRTLILASSSTSSSSDATTTASRDSNGSSSSSSSFSDLLLPQDCDSSRPSSVTEDDAAPRPGAAPRRANYFSSFATRFSSVFRGSKKVEVPSVDASPKKEKSPTAKEVFRKYVKKVKPLYEKLKQTQTQPSNHTQKKLDRADHGCAVGSAATKMYARTHSFSGNLRYPRRKKCVGSCPSSMRSSPTHSGLLFHDVPTALSASSSSSSMEDLQSAIQGAIAHCKSTMMNQTARQKAVAVVAVGEA